MKANWRLTVLGFLLVVPVLLYIMLGALWLAEHRGFLGIPGELLTYAALFWMITGAAFAVLSKRWTRPERPVLPPIDWDRPGTFTDRDLGAWSIVQEVAARDESITSADLAQFDTYIETGKRLARDLSVHYHPQAHDPIERVPVVELMAACQLALEDLDHLCREIPGADLFTPGHFRNAVKAASYMQRANDLYTVLLPLFQPLTGLARLGTQRMVTRPAWQDIQLNVTRWFYRAFVNRLGTHLIELYSGRLAIGPDDYRTLRDRFGKPRKKIIADVPLRLALAGAKGSGKSRLREALMKRLPGMRHERVETARPVPGAGPPASIELLELPSYPPDPEAKPRRPPAALAQAGQIDLLLLTIDARRDDLSSDARFLEAWTGWFDAHPGLRRPPTLVVLTFTDQLVRDDAPGATAESAELRQKLARLRLSQIQQELPLRLAGSVEAGLTSEESEESVERLLASIVPLLAEAERGALLRQLQQHASRSTVGRLFEQIGQGLGKLWSRSG